MEQVEKVITSLRETDGYLELIFMNGACWGFYKFLKVLFPTAIPYKVSLNVKGCYDHIITKIEDTYYDITGVVSPKDFLDLKMVEKSDIKELEKWCFSKNNFIFKRCHCCGEEILVDTSGNVLS